MIDEHAIFLLAQQTGRSLTLIEAKRCAEMLAPLLQSIESHTPMPQMLPSSLFRPFDSCPWRAY